MFEECFTGVSFGHRVYIDGRNLNRNTTHREVSNELLNLGLGHHRLQLNRSEKYLIIIFSKSQHRRKK